MSVALQEQTSERKDGRMPARTNDETARIMRRQPRDLKAFITPNSGRCEY
jgi:hypothetical protein